MKANNNLRLLDTLELDTEGVYLGWLPVTQALRNSAAHKKWLHYMGGKSSVLFGAPGQGKNTTSAAYTGATCTCSMTVNTPKGEDAYLWIPRRRAMGHTCCVINPFGLPDTAQVSMSTARFNPMAAKSFNPGHPDFAASVGMLNGSIILPDGGNSFFTDSARKLVSGVSAFVCTLPPADRNLVTVNSIIQARGDKFIRYMRYLHECGLAQARDAAAPYLVAEPPRSAWEVLETASTQIGQLMEADGIKYVLSGSDFAWSDLKEQKITVYICLPEAHAKRYFRFTRLLFASAFQALLTLPPSPVWFIMDELATSLGDQSLDQIETAMSLGRGYGLRLQCIFQSYAQAENLFGKDLAKALIGSAEILQAYTVNDEATARMLCDRAGTRTELALEGWQDMTRPMTTNGGMPGGITWTPGSGAISVPLYRPQDIYGLSRDKTIIFKEGLAHPIEAFRTPYYRIPALAALASENPYAPKTTAPMPAPPRVRNTVRSGWRRFWRDLVSGAWVMKGSAHAIFSEENKR